MTIRRHLALLALLAALALPGQAPTAHAQDAPAAPVADVVAALRSRLHYERAPFEMRVTPPIKMKGGLVVETLHYPSPVDSVDPERNDRVVARLFRTADPEPALVVALGGWKFDPLTPELGQRLARTGVQVLLVEMPFQGVRTPKGKRPGDITLSSDLDQNEATFVQLAQDVQRAVDWMVRERGVNRKRLGVMGTSLGGFAAALFYGMNEQFRAAAVQLAGADVASVLFNGNWLTRHIEADLAAKGLSEDDVRRRLRGITPGTYAKATRKDGLLLIAAEFDEIVPLDTVKDLARAYGGARLVIMPKAPHRAAQGLRDAFPELKAHFTRTLLDPWKDR